MFTPVTRVLTAVAVAATFAAPASASLASVHHGVRPPMLYVLNAYFSSAEFSTVAVVNATTGAFIKSIRVESNASDIALAPNRKTVYVISPNCGACMLASRSGPSLLGTVTPISTASNKAQKPIMAIASTIAITRDSRTAYVATCCSPVAGDYDFITPLNLVTGKRGKTIKVGSGPSDLAITPNGRTLYVSSVENFRKDGAVTPVNIATGKAGKAVRVGASPGNIAITPGSRFAYVANNGSGTVTVIRVATNTAIKQIKTGAGPDVIAITPNGRVAFISNQGARTVTAISTVTNKVIKQINVGRGPGSIAITPDGRTAYVAVGNAVVPIRIATDTALKPIKVRVPLSAIAITPDGKTVWVTGGCTVSTTTRGWVIAISTATNTIGPSLKVGVCPNGLVIAP
jgi:YVTN family beta-propeller protein